MKSTTRRLSVQDRSIRVAILVLALGSMGQSNCSSSPEPGGTGTFTVFGPETYERTTGEPRTMAASFSVQNPRTDYFLRIQNGAGGARPVTSAAVSLNGAPIVGPSALDPKVAHVQRRVALAYTNELSIRLQGKPRSALSVQVFGLDPEPPTIEAIFSPEPNANGWNNSDVTVSFRCDDAISGVAECSDPVAISSEGDAQLVTGTALDRAGNEASVTVAVRVDKTPPRIERSWPPDGGFGTDRSFVEIEGSIVDDLSGPFEGTVRDGMGALSVPLPAFLVVRDLETDIPPGERSRKNAFRLEAIDAAGNTTQQSFVVRHTLAATMLPTDPNRTEMSPDGVSTSVDRALVRFEPGIDLEMIHAIIGQAGGRLAGFLPSTATALAQFPTESIADLRAILAALELRTEVRYATPVTFSSVNQFDNDGLTANQGVAYTHVKSSLAADFIIDNDLPLDAVHVAVIDSGLDVALGRNGELAGIDFYDLCTAEGREGNLGAPFDNPLNPHGSSVTGIIVGANNGDGNNGLIRGIPGSDFEVSVFRCNCDPTDPLANLDHAMILTAMELIIDGSVPDVGVVNMSFGNIVDPGDRASRADGYRDYFDSVDGREILWVGSAGNDGVETDCGEFLPGGLSCALDNVVAVAAHDPTSLNRANFSNFGRGISLSAPGVGVWTVDGVGTYAAAAGTSMAAPMVSGAAALLLAVAPVDAPTAKDLLIEETQPLVDLDLPQGGLDVLGVIVTKADSQEFCGNSAGEDDSGSYVGFLSQPGMTGFNLEFSNGDHEIYAIDATFRTTSGTFRVIYSDKNGDDPFGWCIAGQDLPPGTVFDSLLFGPSSGSETKPLPVPPDVGDVEAVLVGFGCSFFAVTSGDPPNHKMDRISAWVSRGGPSPSGFLGGVAFNDKNDDDAFTCRIDYALVPLWRVLERGTAVGGSATGSDSMGIDSRRPFLAGFSLEFESDDHNLEEVGVELSPGFVDVSYNDDNDDDEFSWWVDWVDLR